MKIGILSIILLGISLSFVSGHVSYVIGEEQMKVHLGSDWRFLGQALDNPLNIILTILVGSISAGLYFFLNKRKEVRKEIKEIKKESKTYDEFISPLARIALAIALIGASVTETMISPSVNLSSSIIIQLELILGFAIFIGFLTGVAVWMSLFLYLLALWQTPYIIGNLDFFGLGLVILAFATEKPGIGDVIGMKMYGGISKIKKYIPKILHISLGIAMIYLAIYEKILNPHISELVVLQYNLTSLINVSPEMWVLSTGIIEGIIGLFMLFSIKPRLTSAITLIVLSGSFFYFNEAVYTHITLFVSIFIIFILGDRKL